MITSYLKDQKIFLVDALGAMISVLSLSIPYFLTPLFGMPKSTLALFMLIAALYATYSGTLYLTKPKKWKPFLSLIAVLNILYCLFTAYHLFKNTNSITIVGYFYFVGEIAIITTLAILELNLSRSNDKD